MASFWPTMEISGNGVNAVGKKGRADFGGGAENVATGDAALFHGRGGERRKADDVAGRVNIGDGGLKVLIDLEFAARRGEARRLPDSANRYWPGGLPRTQEVA